MMCKNNVFDLGNVIEEPLRLAFASPRCQRLRAPTVMNDKKVALNGDRQFTRKGTKGASGCIFVKCTGSHARFLYSVVLIIRNWL